MTCCKDIIKAELEEKQFKVKLTVIDTPGFGDYVNNRESWMPIIDFIVSTRLTSCIDASDVIIGAETHPSSFAG